MSSPRKRGSIYKMHYWEIHDCGMIIKSAGLWIPAYAGMTANLSLAQLV